VIGERGMAILAGVVHAAALQLDGNDVIGSAIVLATSLRVKICTTHVPNGRGHCGHYERRISDKQVAHPNVNRIKL
jgi:hypothetical protein